MSSSIQKSIEELSHSPLLPQALEQLRQQLADERLRRDAFYRDMTPDQKVEFIDGQVVLHSPARSRHMVVAGYIFQLLNTYVLARELGLVYAEKCLVVFPRNDYEPDVVYFNSTAARNIDDSTMQFPIPDLVVEVLSTSTEHRDRGMKFDDYEANGVKEYWIVDADRNGLEQYVLHEGRYRAQFQSTTGLVTCETIPGLSFDVAACFDRDQNLACIRNLLLA